MDEQSLLTGDTVDQHGAAPRPDGHPLEGQSVLLSPIAPQSDGKDLYRVSHGTASNESLWTYMGYGPFDSESGMAIWLEGCASSTDPLFLKVVDRVSGSPVGMVSYLNIVPDAWRLELGNIWYAPSVQRSNTNTETIYLMLCESFDRLGYRRVEWKCDALNARSRAAALRLGFQYEGTFRQHLIYKGRNRDTAWFAMLYADWPRIKTHFERWLYANRDGSLSLTEMNASDA